MGHTTILKCDKTNPDIRCIERGVEVIKKGGVIAYPTDTVYGLGGHPFLDSVRKKIYQIKNRPLNKPLPLIIGHRKMLKKLCSDISNLAGRLMDIFWPGALTIIIPDGKGNNIGVRWPNNTVAEKLSLMSDLPLLATSANISGNSSTTDPARVMKELEGKFDLFLDAGILPPNPGSTVIDVTKDRIEIIREGAISAEILRSKNFRVHIDRKQ